MSWPSDGGPRYIVRETGGYTLGSRAGVGGASTPNFSVAVMDRAYCHRVVLNLPPLVGPLAARRHLARERAAVLEASHLAALSH